MLIGSRKWNSSRIFIVLSHLPFLAGGLVSLLLIFSGVSFCLQFPNHSYNCNPTLNQTSTINWIPSRILRLKRRARGKTPSETLSPPYGSFWSRRQDHSAYRRALSIDDGWSFVVMSPIFRYPDHVMSPIEGLHKKVLNRL